MAEKILVVDDEEIIRDSLSYILKENGYNVDTAVDGSDAIDKIEDNNYDLVITDLKMPKVGGIELLEKISSKKTDTFTMVITAYASVDSAVSALRSGAYDYIIKPLDFDEVILKVKRLFEYKSISKENVILRREVHKKYDFSNIIGKSASMQKVYELIKKVSNSDGTVLITGKTGTGKELVAKAIHYNGKRAGQPLITVNCGAIVETLIESELFGHLKGSFTGAIRDKIGLFAAADKGTFFLDEISELPMHLQVKLLRAIETSEITPVGGTKSHRFDVRIIAATNKDIETEVTNGNFREDLYFRLNVVEVRLPSLSEREGDIELLLNHFIDKLNREMGKNIEGAEDQVLSVLKNHKWRGEVRELENIVERAMIFTEGPKLSIQDLPESISAKSELIDVSSAKDLSTVMGNFEINHILSELKNNNWDKKKTSELLGISLSSLYRKLEQHEADSQS
ncbi:MAG: sigma-54-dependent Fis family transcriptional regulator [Candidatus Marinimicrobia bacterium]|nr:sigma-54-dependent Fis family transcriptional regulator [Candidatus Neomarinimicrobiota bacterium]